MNVIDIILGIPLAWALYRGFKKGLILELATLVGLIVGLYAGLHFSGLVSSLVREQWNLTQSWLPVLIFALIFIGVLFGVYLIGKMLEKTAEMLMLGFLNKIGGAFFSLVKMTLVLSFLLMILNTFAPGRQLFPKEKTDGSILYGPVRSFAPWIVPKAKTIRAPEIPLKEI